MRGFSDVVKIHYNMFVSVSYLRWIFQLPLNFGLVGVRSTHRTHSKDGITLARQKFHIQMVKVNWLFIETIRS